MSSCSKKRINIAKYILQDFIDNKWTNILSAKYHKHLNKMMLSEREIVDSWLSSEYRIRNNR